MEVAGALLLVGVLVPRTVGVVLLVVAWATGPDAGTLCTTGVARLIATPVLDFSTR